MGTRETYSPGASGKEVAAAGLILLLAMFLRFFNLGFNSLWLDEVYSVTTAESPIQQLLTSTQLYSQPPLYTLLLHFWLPAGSSEFMLRFPSLFFGVLSVAVLYRFSRPLFGAKVALLSALLLTVSPLHVWYSQEVRSYALTSLLGLASVYFFSRVLSKGSIISWLGYTIATLAGLYANYGIIVVIAGQNLFILIFILRSGNKRLASRWSIGQGFLLLGFYPWLPYMSDSLQAAFKDYSTLVTIEQFLKRLGTDSGTLLIVGVVSTLMLTTIVLLVAIAYQLWPRRHRLLQSQPVLLVLVLGAYTVVTLLSAFPQGASIRRQLLVFLPFFLLAVSIGSSRLKLASPYLLTAALVVAAPALSANYFLNQKEQWREVAQLVEARGEEGDLVLLHASYTVDPFRHYYTGELPYKGVPLQGLSVELQQAISAYERVWLVLSSDKYVDPEGKLREWFDSCYKPELSAEFAYVTVQLYEVARKGCPF